MNTVNEISRMVRGSGLGLASILLAAFMTTWSASAQYKPTGDDGITASPKVRAQLDGRRVSATSVSTASTPAMACPKCTDGWVAVSDASQKGLGARTLMGQTTRLVAKHLCNGCGTDWNVAGAGKAKQAVASHKCTGCGAENLACCSGKSFGALATKGMDQQIQVAPLK